MKTKGLSRKPLLPLLWLALFSVTLQAQSLTCSVELFRIKGPFDAGPPDLTGLKPYAVQVFTVVPGQRQVVKTMIGDLALNSSVAVSEKSKQEEYLTVFDLELIERSTAAPHHETKAAVNTRLALKLNQPTRASYMTESSDQAKFTKVWLVTLSP